MDAYDPRTGFSCTNHGAIPTARVLIAAALMGGGALLRAFGFEVLELAFPAAALAWAAALRLAAMRGARQPDKSARIEAMMGRPGRQR